MEKLFDGHINPLYGCNEYLPKPKRKHQYVLVACPKCNRVYTARRGYVSYYWERVQILVGK